MLHLGCVWDLKDEFRLPKPRALAPGSAAQKTCIYEVVKPLPVIQGEAKAGDSALTALGENRVSTLNRNLAAVKDSIKNSPNIKTEIKDALLEQIDGKTYQIELYTTTENAAKTASRIDDTLIGRIGQPISRVVTFEKIK